MAGLWALGAEQLHLEVAKVGVQGHRHLTEVRGHGSDRRFSVNKTLVCFCILINIPAPGCSDSQEKNVPKPDSNCDQIVTNLILLKN